MFIDDEKIMLENVAKRSISYLELVVKLLGNHWQDLRTEKLECSVTSVMSNSLQPHGQHPARLPCSRDLPAKNTGVGCHALLQRIFPIQGLNPHLLCLLHCRQFFTPEPPGKPQKDLQDTLKKKKKTNRKRRQEDEQICLM